MAEQSKLSAGQLILIPSVITLAVTLLRLVGELQHWPTAFFNREAGGAGSIIGITWLAFVFGVYFAMKLCSAGEAPSSAGRTIAYSLAGLLVTGVGIAFGIPGGKLNFPGKEPISWLLVACGGLNPVLYGWRSLGKVLLAYAYAARLPVLLIMFYSITRNWDTHYSLGPPGVEFTEIWTKFVEIAVLPQMILWIAFTVIMGSLAGGITAAVLRRKPTTEQAA